MLGINVDAGFVFGGEDLVEVGFSDGSTSTLSAGQGISLAGGVTVMPLWLGDRVGLGLAGDAGWKFATVGASNGSINLERVPLSVMARGVVGIAANYHVVAGAGLTAELSPTLYGDGDVNLPATTFDDAFGPLFQLGFLFGQPRNIGAELAARVALLKYSLMGETVDATYGGVSAKLHFFF